MTPDSAAPERVSDGELIILLTQAEDPSFWCLVADLPTTRALVNRAALELQERRALDKKETGR